MKTTIVLALGLMGASSLPFAAAETVRQMPGHSVRVQTRKNTASPGVAKELAPDSKQSATGGQAGGLPGQQ